MSTDLALSPYGRSNWEVVVIGAGPAGSIAARQLAVAGLSVLLVEHKSIPRGKVCGGCVSARAWELLRRIGVERAASESGRIDLGAFCVRSETYQWQTTIPPGGAVSRAAFDAALTRAAVCAGAQLATRTRARVGPFEEGWRVVELTPASDLVGSCDHKAQVHVRARVVLAADGLGHPSLHQLREFESHVSPASRLGGACTLPNPPELFLPGTIYMAVGRGGYVGLVVGPGGQLHVAAALDPRLVRYRGGLACAAAEVVRETGWPSPHELQGAEWRGTPPLTRAASRLAAPGLFLLGDAAGYPEPFTGEGIAWAITSGIAVAPYAVAAAHRWSAELEPAWAACYRRLVQHRQWICRMLVRGLRSPLLTRSALQLLAAFPYLAIPLVNWLNRPLNLPHVYSRALTP